MATHDFELDIKKDNKEQYYEVSNIAWLNLQSAITKMRPINKERQVLLTKLDFMLKNEFFAMNSYHILSIEPDLNGKEYEEENISDSDEEENSIFGVSNYISTF